MNKPLAAFAGIVAFAAAGVAGYCALERLVGVDGAPEGVEEGCGARLLRGAFADKFAEKKAAAAKDVAAGKGVAAKGVGARAAKKAARGGAAGGAAAGKAHRPGTVPLVAIEDRTDLSDDDKKTMLAIERAMEGEDLAAVRAAVPRAAASANAAVRAEIVDSLAWFGQKAIVDLLPFMADQDEDVAESAIDNWTMALSEIEDEAQKCAYIEAAMRVLTDEDALEGIITEIMDCDDRLIMQTIVNIIDTGTPQAVKAAKEQYEFQTGDEYTSVEAAEEWLRENCEGAQ